MRKVKLFYTEEGQLLYSRHWPEVPEIQASIYKDAAMMNDFENKMKILLRYPVPVTNPDKAFLLIVEKEPLERGNFYEIETDFEIHHNDNGYTCELK